MNADYDKVLKKQRLLIYKTRNNLLDKAEVDDKLFINIANEVIDEFMKQNRNADRRLINRYILDNISYRLDDDMDEYTIRHKKDLKAYLMDKVKTSLDQKKKMFKDEEDFNDFIRNATLTSIDNEWVEEVDYLQQLQTAVSGRSTAQRNPVYEYQNDALESYRQMEEKVYKNIMRNVLLSTVSIKEDGKMSIVFP